MSINPYPPLGWSDVLVKEAWSEDRAAACEKAGLDQATVAPRDDTNIDHTLSSSLSNVEVLMLRNAVFSTPRPFWKFAPKPGSSYIRFCTCAVRHNVTFVGCLLVVCWLAMHRLSVFKTPIYDFC